MGPLKRRGLIVEVGARNGAFAQELRRTCPDKTVLATDREATAKRVLRKSLGETFAGMNENVAERVEQVWINHVNIRTSAAHQELKEIVKKIKPGTQVFLTVRQENLEATRHSLEAAGLKIKSETQYNPKMRGSETTKKFFEMAKREPKYTPIRILAIKLAKQS